MFTFYVQKSLSGHLRIKFTQNLFFIGINALHNCVHGHNHGYNLEAHCTYIYPVLIIYISVENRDIYVAL